MTILKDVNDRRSMVCSLILIGRLDDGAALRDPPTFGWEPDERDRTAILLEIADCALGTADSCGADSEEAAEARELYFSVRDKPLEEAKDDIQGFFFDMYEAVMGEIDKYYDKYPELRRLIRLTLGMREEG